MKKFVFDISRVEFEEKLDSKEFNATTLYFIAPKEWLDGFYPEAIHSEISVEYPLGFIPDAHEVTVMMSPTRVDEDGNSEDYGWFDVELAYSDIEALLSLAENDKSKNHIVEKAEVTND